MRREKLLKIGGQSLLNFEFELTFFKQKTRKGNEESYKSKIRWSYINHTPRRILGPYRRAELH